MGPPGRPYTRSCPYVSLLHSSIAGLSPIIKLAWRCPAWAESPEICFQNATQKPRGLILCNLEDVRDAELRLFGAVGISILDDVAELTATADQLSSPG